MNKRNKAAKAAAVSLAVMLASPLNIFASTFKDVSQTYWAYDAINSISSQGLMVGDLSGNFNPSSYIDKFDTSKILAKVIGYNYNSASAQDKAYFDKLYTEKKSFIDQYSNAFSKWNSTSDKEVAFLLEKGILKNEDLNQFVIKGTDGKEQLRALSREEFAVFLVRIMGKENEASQYNTSQKFSDDSLINAAKKQSVYYLKSIGIISGNTDGKFRPNGAVTRADFCVLLDNTLKYMGKTVSANTSLGVNQPSDVIVNNVETVVGSLDKYFPSLNVVQINIGTTQKLYKVTPAASIKIDGFNSSLADLKEGMQVTVLLNNSEVIQLTAVSTASSDALNSNTNNLDNTNDNANDLINTPNIDSSDVNNLNGSNLPNTSPNINSSAVNASISDDDFTTVLAVVENINGNNITLKYNTADSGNEVNYQSKTYTISENAVITKNSAASSSQEINTDDIVNAKILGSKIYSIDVENESISINKGKLIKKYYNSEKSMPALVIESDGDVYEFFVASSSNIARNIDDETDWNDLKIGDKVDVKANLNKIESLKASGEERSLEGYITELRISNDESYIGFSENENGNNSKLYAANSDTVDLYSVKVGDKVKMFLESDEISTVNVKKSNSKNTATGYITSVKPSYIYVETSEKGNSDRKKITFDDDTVVLSSITGKNLKIKDLEEDMQIYIVFDESDSKLAKTITILNTN